MNRDASVSDRKPPYLLIGGVALAVVVAVVLLWVFIGARATSNSTVCIDRLRAIGVALQKYYAENGAYPPAYSTDDEAKPANSWRLQLVGALTSEPVPSAYDFSKPWNSPNNSRVLPKDSEQVCFQCPAARNPEPGITNYVAVIGPKTMWNRSSPVERAADGSDDDKILVIEVVNSNIRWMEPLDLTLEEALLEIQPRQGIGIGSAHPDGIHYLTVGGDVRTLDPKIDRESLRKLLVRERAKPAQ